MRLLWLSDIHLNFLSEERLEEFTDDINKAAADIVVISGDIGEAPSVSGYLTRLSLDLRQPIFFVLGNHDFYHGSVASVREAVGNLKTKSQLVYLNNVQELPLTRKTAIIGHDSWADGRLGNFLASPVLMNDHLLIQEFQPSAIDGDRLSEASKQHRLTIMQRLAAQAEAHFRKSLPTALEKFENVFLVTHVPPFRQSCWFKGKIANDDFLPHFASMQVGNLLKEIMEQSPNRKLTVVCGHTHSPGRVKILPNLEVFTGGAEYGEPTVQRIFEIE